ncbi:PD-(D/E)XK nuclease family protein [Motiliproteus sp. MSK22-1]|uniref:PD-(D/E)XK nuclease family protein n=1 Tax=Motiliproteus sp. MSK22-1 TaxID=1897630 RepID=UPI001E2FEABB|nr:PD-(D/E)XK nuclease family protein [Motiliproteus sp. MSK22-1]
MKTLFDIQPLLPAIASGRLVLTPNRRLSAKVLAAYAEHQSLQNEKAWHTPRVMPLEGWIQQQWLEYQDRRPAEPLGILMDNRQELLLWEQVVLSDREASPLLKPSGAAAQAQSAYKTLTRWQQTVSSEAYLEHQSPNDIFSRWCATFESIRDKDSRLVAAQVIEYLIEELNDNPSLKEPEIHLVAFQEQPPLYEKLLESLSDTIVRVQQPSRNRFSGLVQRSGVDDELQLAAQWARQVVTHSPDATIGIVVPDLSIQRAKAERIFREVFEQGYDQPEIPADAPTFNMSIGIPLLQAPVITSALKLLMMKTTPIRLTELPAFLYSAFIPGLNQELESRVEFEYLLRSRAKPEFSLAELSEYCGTLTNQNRTQEVERPGTTSTQEVGGQFSQGSLFQADEMLMSDNQPTAGCPALLKVFNVLQQQRYPDRERPGYWSQWLHGLLLSLGWPGDRTPNSLEYQQIEQWYELLSSFSRFDELTGKISLAEALKLLSKETQASIFQPKTTDSPVQILGPLEAAGLDFTHLWLMGLSDDCWPAPPSPNPLLPVTFQRQRKMPHATPERELEFAAQLTQNYLESAEIVIFSYPDMRDDQQLRPSALISHHSLLSVDQIPLKTLSRVDSQGLSDSVICFDHQQQLPAIAQQQLNTSPLELVDTGTAPAVSEREREGIRGGSALLKNQALCPFSAFAINRLNARPLESAAAGLSAADRGNMLHNALEILWRELKTSAALAHKTEQQLTRLIDQTCAKTLIPFKAKSPRWMGARFWSIEQRRLSSLLHNWLNVEKQRTDFKVIAIEQTLKSELGGLPLTLRIDRIDQLSDGSIVLIDYKTGESKPRNWCGERPKEPQLPLYAVSSRKQTSAVSFAQINVKATEFRGISSGEKPAPGILPASQQRLELPEDWPQLLDHWHSVLEALALDFMQGKTPVDPVDNSAYNYTGLESLNRYFEFEQLSESKADQTAPASPEQTGSRHE